MTVEAVDVDAPPARGRLFAYLLAFVLLGIGLSAGGPALVHIRDRAGVGVGLSGLVLGGQAIGYIAGSLASGGLYDRGHGHRALVAGACGMALALGAASLVTSLAAVTLAFVAVGAAAAMVDVGGNTMVVWGRSSKDVGSSLNALHLCFGIGALTTPLLVTLSVDRTDSFWLVALALGAGTLVLWAMLRGVTTPHRAPVARSTPATPATPVTPAPVPSRRLLAIVALFFFLYVGSEGTMAGWVATYGDELELGGPGAASWLASTFFAGFTLGRVVAVVIARRLTATTLLIGSCLGSMVAAFALAATDHRSGAVWVGTAAFGFFLGPQYASMMAVGDQRLRLSGSWTSLIIAASGVGGLLLPVGTGWVLDRRGATALPWALLVASIATTTVAALVVSARPGGRVAGRARTATPTG
ncbi:MAG: MFS transporter [Ilumatobacteraceae bacterium]